MIKDMDMDTDSKIMHPTIQTIPIMKYTTMDTAVDKNG